VRDLDVRRLRRAKTTEEPTPTPVDLAGQYGFSGVAGKASKPALEVDIRQAYPARSELFHARDRKR
jgi:hypothetical protein